MEVLWVRSDVQLYWLQLRMGTDTRARKGFCIFSGRQFCSWCSSPSCTPIPEHRLQSPTYAHLPQASFLTCLSHYLYFLGTSKHLGIALRRQTVTTASLLVSLVLLSILQRWTSLLIVLTSVIWLFIFSYPVVVSDCWFSIWDEQEVTFYIRLP